MESAAEGDVAAIQRLLEAHYLPLQAFLRRHAGALVAGKESSSDLVQSVCREALEGLREERLEYRGDAEFKQWLYQAALLKLMKRRRHYSADRRDAGRELGLGAGGAPEAGEVTAREETPSRIVHHQEVTARLQEMLTRLPTRFEQVLRYAYLDELSHLEIAERLGIQSGNARVLLSRARARLATLMAMESESGAAE